MNSFKFSELKQGLNLEFNIVITESMMNDFLKLSGDTNPLHIDEGYAKTNGFHSRVVYGMLTSSFYSQLVGVYLPGKYAFLQSISIDFIKPLYIGDKITIFGEVSGINELFKFIEIKSYIKRDSVKISRAKIKVGLFE